MPTFSPLLFVLICKCFDRSCDFATSRKLLSSHIQRDASFSGTRTCWPEKQHPACIICIVYLRERSSFVIRAHRPHTQRSSCPAMCWGSEFKFTEAEGVHRVALTSLIALETPYRSASSAPIASEPRNRQKSSRNWKTEVCHLTISNQERRITKNTKNLSTWRWKHTVRC